jgi:glutathione S-transferase
MIKLYGYGPAWDFPDCSPFVTKVDCYLRMVELPYTLVPWHTLQDLQNAPKGKFPYIEDNGQKIADSTFIIAYLKASYGDKLGEQHFTVHDRAVAHSMRVMLEEHLYWVLGYTQWLEDAAWEAYKPVFFGNLSPTEQQIATAQLREIVRSNLQVQGLGRHSREEIYELGQADLSAVSAYLGDKPYCMGDRPTALDATAYAFLSRTLWVPYESPLKTHAESLTNVAAYCRRMKERYYSSNNQR